ncbi:MAG: type II toxin-antitoxin system VapC family toxin [Candidatus Bathyarchaeia archaeon]
MSLELSTKEVGNALLKKARKGEIRIQDAEEIPQDLAKSDIVKTHSQNDLIPEAFKTATKHETTIHDAIYIELAKRLKTELITSDRRQAEIAVKEGVKVKRYEQP